MAMLLAGQEKMAMAAEAAKFETRAHWIEGMEDLSRGYVAHFVMWVLAVLAMIQTIVEIVIMFPCWAIWYRNKKIVVSHLMNKWYKGPWLCSSIFFDGPSRTLRAIRESAAGYKALHHIYNWRDRARWPDVNLDTWWFGEWVADWWIHMDNARAVRNRRVMVRYLIGEKLRLFADLYPGQTLRILSIACGSAQPLQEALVNERAYLQKRNVTIELRLLDKDAPPLEHCVRLAERFGLTGWVRMITHQCSYHDAAKVCGYGLWQPWLIEMIGLMDYLPTKKGVEAERMIYGLLAPGGYHLTGHILANSEAYVLRWLIAWPMRYRSPEDLGAIVAAEGAFPQGNVTLWLVPGQVHVLAEAHKLSGSFFGFAQV